MKKIIMLLILAIVVLFAVKGVTTVKKAGEDKKAADYEKIEKVTKALEKVVLSKAILSFNDRGRWYMFDLRVLKDKDEQFYKDLYKELGEDFDNKLSTGDYIFGGVLPYIQSYRVYAGDPTKESNMLYPDWNYTKLEKKDEKK